MIREVVNLNARKRPMGWLNRFVASETNWNVPLFLEGSG
jgi:hypothetical protein